MGYLEILNNTINNTIIINLKCVIMLKPSSISILPPYILAQGIYQDLYLVSMDSRSQGSLLGSLQITPLFFYWGNNWGRVTTQHSNKSNIEIQIQKVAGGWDSYRI